MPLRHIILCASLLTAPAVAAKCDLQPGITTAQARSGLCGFDPATGRFQGTPAEQARCLTRTVKVGAAIGEPNLPAELERLIGQPVAFTLAKLRAYLAAQSIAAADLGGDLAVPIAAEYFVIHDTSTPNCSEAGACPVRGAFPDNINEATWSANRTFHGHKPPTTKSPVAHVMTNRVGESITMLPFNSHISHVKFDFCNDAAAKRGLFLGVENIQPRIGRPAIPAAGHDPNDLIAPDPGFSDAQYKRLALVYVAASQRRGKWLVPAYHAVIDSRYRNGHDDPQKFDIDAFSRQLLGIIAAIG